MNEDNPGKWHRPIGSGEAATDFIEAGLYRVLKAVDAVEKVTGLDLLKRRPTVKSGAKARKPPVSERDVDRSGRV